VNDHKPSRIRRRSDPFDWVDLLQRRRLEMTIVEYIGGSTAIVVMVFSVYRFYTGDFSGGLTNAVIVALITTSILLGQIRRLENGALILFGFVSSISCLLSALVVSPNGLLWTYLVLWVNVVILPRWLSMLLNGLIIIVLTANHQLFSNLLHQVSWAAVAIMFSGFGLVFTSQLRRQRRLLTRLASQDPLTGAGNRRLMQHDLQTVVAEFKRRGQPSTLMVLDLDYFKQLNDQHGHEAGDLALEQFSQDVRAALRTEDGLYRMGGEEFVALLRGMDEDSARKTLPDLHRRLSGATRGPGGPIHFSAGVAVIRPGEDWSRWLARADDALYRAKAGGRDRLEMAAV